MSRLISKSDKVFAHLFQKGMLACGKLRLCLVGSRLDLEGDVSFVEFFSIEKIYGGIKIEVKNPSGAGERWTPYDRGGYSGENIIRIYTGSAWSNVDIYNYLDITVEESEKENGIFEWICHI